jgi:hypothetical protein
LPRAASASQRRRTNSLSRREYETKRSATRVTYEALVARRNCIIIFAFPPEPA